MIRLQPSPTRTPSRIPLRLAERAKTVGYPERFAQEALGDNSKAVHRVYTKRALMKSPSLEDSNSWPSRRMNQQYD